MHARLKGNLAHVPKWLPPGAELWAIVPGMCCVLAGVSHTHRNSGRARSLAAGLMFLAFKFERIPKERVEPSLSIRRWLHPALQLPHFILAVWERTTIHLSPRFSKTSIQTDLWLLSFPSAMLVSLTLPWTTATLPNTFTYIGPI